MFLVTVVAAAASFTSTAGARKPYAWPMSSICAAERTVSDSMRLDRKTTTWFALRSATSDGLGVQSVEPLARFSHFVDSASQASDSEVSRSRLGG